MLLNLTAVMDGIATLCAGQAQNVYAYPVETATVPCVIVGYPSRMTYDAVFARGGDEMEVPVYAIVGKSGTDDARNALSSLLDGGSMGMKAALDGVHSFGDVRVIDVAVEAVSLNAVEYIAAKFILEII